MFACRCDDGKVSLEPLKPALHPQHNVLRRERHLWERCESFCGHCDVDAAEECGEVEAAVPQLPNSRLIDVEVSAVLLFFVLQDQVDIVVDDASRFEERSQGRSLQASGSKILKLLD